MKWTTIVILFFHFQGFAQNLVPSVRPFTTFDYGADHQNWSIDQAENGLIYVGNQKGLLEFDGSKWSLYHLPDHTIVRSVKCIGNRIYVGSYNQFGYFEPNDKNQLTYHSLSDVLHDYQFTDEEFWQIEQIDKGLAFRSFRDIYIVGDATVSPMRLKFLPDRIQSIDSVLYVSSLDKRLFVLKGNDFVELDFPEEISSSGNIILGKNQNEELVLCGSNFTCFTYAVEQFFPINFPNSDFFADNLLNQFLVLDDGTIVLGSIQKGILVLNSSMQLDYQLKQENGLTNSTVLNLISDFDGNIWLALDDGISFVNHQSPNRYFVDRTGDVGAVYALVKHNNQLYLGTNKGVFYFENNQLKQIQGISGQVWTLQVINNQLFCGQNNGTFLIEGNQARQISNYSGVWTIKNFPNSTSHYLQSTYNGFVDMEISGEPNFFRYIGILSPFRNFEFQSDDQLVALHAYEDVFSILLNQNQSFLRKNLTKFFPEDENQFAIINLNHQVIVKTNLNWRRYDPLLDSLVVDHSLEALLTNAKNSELLRSNESDVVWLRSQDLVSRLNLKTKEKLQQSFYQLAPRSINRYESVFAADDQFYLTLNNGFVQSSFASKPISVKSVQLLSIYNSRDTISNFTKNGIKFNYEQNTIHIDYYIPEFAEDIQFEYRFHDNQGWNKTSESHLVFENMPSGTHEFQIRALYTDGRFSNTERLKFRVKLPIWLQWYAILFYLLLGFLIYFSVRRYQKAKYKRKLREDEERLRQEHELELKDEKILNEKNVAQLKSKQLEKEVEYRQQELTNTTLNLVKKTELLTKIKTELLIAQKETRNVHVDSVIKLINQSLSRNENWNLFETQFNELHSEFLNKLKAEYPDLTRKDLKLCAYLKSNLTSKEIAPLMDISVRGVETHRYRLRKKLNIDTNENLSIYLENL